MINAKVRHSTPRQANTFENPNPLKSVPTQQHDHGGVNSQRGVTISSNL